MKKFAIIYLVLQVPLAVYGLLVRIPWYIFLLPTLIAFGALSVILAVLLVIVFIENKNLKNGRL